MDSTGDVVTENVEEGTDTVRTTLTSYTLGNNLENLVFTGSIGFVGTGNTLANTLIGGIGNDALDGGTGNDTLIGGLGNDTYIVDAPGDIVIENTGEGTDTVQSSISYALVANVENLTLTGTTAINATGNELNNIITGNSGNNILDGGAGADTLTGGAGNDTYIVDNSGDVIVETGSAGTDLVQSSVTYTLAANVENLTLTGTANIDGSGNTLANILTGNSGNNLLDGGSGADTLIGGAGNDTYVVDNITDVVTENINEGTDLIQASVTYTLAANVENLALTGSTAINGTGNILDNTLTGNSGNNTLDGGTGSDTLIGGAGNDTYVIDNSGDIVTENANEGTDLVQSSITYTLTDNVESLTLTGSGNINGTGNALANTVTGNSGDNTLDGGAGADTLIGGAGNDTYIVDNTGDVVTENATAGTDLVQSSITYTLGSNLENLTLTGTGNINATGNTLDNILIGNSGNNLLTGAAGNDTLTGGAGADVFSFAASGNGTDTITDFSDGDIIRISGANFSSTPTTGDGATLAQNRVQLATSGNVTTLTVGTNTTAGADVTIRLNGVFTANQLSAYGTDISFNHTPTGNVTISGIPSQNQTLTAGNTLTDSDGLGIITYQWQASSNGTDWVNLVNGSVLLLDQTHVSKQIRVVANYTDSRGAAENLSSSPTASVANINDTPTGSVTITGAATKGQVLTAANTLTDLDGLGAISYQWQADGSAITGATAGTFTLTNAQVGKNITVTASYTDGFGTVESVTSSATSPVVNFNNIPTGSVTISGNAMQGQTLTAANTLSDADGLGTISYQWKANGSVISGATNNSVLLTEALVGKAITVTAGYTDGLGTAETVTSMATGPVVNINDAPTGLVTLTGTATQGQILTAGNSLADADGLGAVNYQWKADGSVINGATANTYLLTEAQVGKAITVTAGYTDGHGTAESVTSTATGAVTNVNDAPSGAVIVTGTTTQGQTLTVGNSLADADGLGVISYQWKANGTAINGATTNTFTLSEAEVGKVITVTASYIDGHNTPESVSGSSTNEISNLNDAPVGNVIISGSATQGQILTASNTLGDADGIGSISYQWQANGNNIEGATSATLLLSEAQVGKIITVAAGYIDGHGTAESIAALSTLAIVGYQSGTAGNDTLTGTPFADILNPGIGADLVRGNGGNDTLNLVADGIWGTDFAAVNEGSPGNVGTCQLILLDGKSRFADVLGGGDGIDTLNLTGGSDAFSLHDAFSLFNSNVELTIDGRQMFSSPRATGIELIRGGDGDDIIDLTSSDYLIGGVHVDGGTGNDDLWGNAGDDWLTGGEGNDTLFGGVGNNILNGGAGADVFQFVKLGSANDIIEDFLPGTDHLQLYGATSFSEVAMIQNSDNVTLLWGDQTIVLNGITSTAGANDWFQRS